MIKADETNLSTGFTYIKYQITDQFDPQIPNIRITE